MNEAPVGDSNAGNALMSRRTLQRIWLMFKQRLVFFFFMHNSPLYETQVLW
jgi:hypothetical protein